MPKVTPEEFKAELRQLSLAKRDAIPPDVRAVAAETIAGRPFPYQIKPGMVISAYSPMQSELNPVPLMRKLADAGAKLALPVVVGRGGARRRRDGVAPRQRRAAEISLELFDGNSGHGPGYAPGNQARAECGAALAVGARSREPT